MSKIDHPQYHPTVFKRIVGACGRKLTDEERAKHTWRGGAKVRK